MRFLLFMCLVFLSHCKTNRHDSANAMNSSSSNSELSLASVLPEESQCKGLNDTYKTQFPFSIEFDHSDLYSDAETNVYLKTLYQSLSNLPDSILNSFKTYKGKIVLTDTIAKYCPSPANFVSLHPEGVGSCWLADDQNNITLYLSLTQDKVGSLSALSFNSLVAFGQLFEKLFLNQVIAGDGELFSWGGENLQEGAEPFRIKMLQELIDRVQTNTPIPFSTDLMSFMMSHSFFAYYCNDNTRNELKQLFPNSYNTIKSLTDSYKPKDIVSISNSQGLNLAGPKFKKSKTSVESIPESRPVLRRVGTVPKPIERSPINSINNQVEHKTFLERNTTAWADAGKESDFKPNIMGKSYLGSPRLVGNELSSEQAFVADDVIILIHGTFSPHSVTPLKAGSWADPGGETARMINAKVAEGKGEVYGFQWSGDLNDAARLQAGAQLAEILKSLNTLGKRVHLIGYSHGGNVATSALSSLKASEGEVVHNLITLGRPVMRSSEYKFDSSQIANEYLYVKGEKDFVPGITGNKTKESSSVSHTEVEVLGKSSHKELVSDQVLSRVLDVLSESHHPELKIKFNNGL